jgi:hypothetical protein
MREWRGRRRLLERHGRLFNDAGFRQLLRRLRHFSVGFVRRRRWLRPLTGAHLLAVSRPHSGSTPTAAATPAPCAL